MSTDMMSAKTTSTTKKQKYQSVRLFKRDWMERFSHVHPITPLVLWGPVVTYLLYQTFFELELPLLPVAAIALAALILWTFVEYSLHRFAFHYDAKSELGKNFVYMIHGLHHVDPNDPTRLVMPVFPAVCYALILYPTFSFIFGPIWVKPFFSFFVIGYLCYDYIHYYTHHFIPKNALGKYLKQYHMTHHYVEGNARWGISNPLWDILFRTYDIKNVKKSAKAVAQPRAPF